LRMVNPTRDGRREIKYQNQNICFRDSAHPIDIQTFLILFQDGCLDIADQKVFG